MMRRPSCRVLEEATWQPCLMVESSKREEKEEIAMHLGQRDFSRDRGLASILDILYLPSCRNNTSNLPSAFIILRIPSIFGIS
jgi:hypothetical protein